MYGSIPDAINVGEPWFFFLFLFGDNGRQYGLNGPFSASVSAVIKQVE